MVAYHYDAFSTVGTPIKSYQVTTITTALTSIHNQFNKPGTRPNIWVLDNEVSNELKLAMVEKTTTVHDIVVGLALLILM